MLGGLPQAQGDRGARHGPVSDHADRTLERAVLAALAQRSSGRSVCPSEVARAVEPGDWRKLMPAVRAAARRLARQGRIVVSQRGVPLDPQAEWRGAIRLERGPGFGE